MDALIESETRADSKQTFGSIFRSSLLRMRTKASELSRTLLMQIVDIRSPYCLMPQCHLVEYRSLSLLLDTHANKYCNQAENERLDLIFIIN